MTCYSCPRAVLTSCRTWFVHTARQPTGARQATELTDCTKRVRCCVAAIDSFACACFQETSVAISCNYIDGSNLHLARQALNMQGFVNERARQLLHALPTTMAASLHTDAVN